MMQFIGLEMKKHRLKNLMGGLLIANIVCLLLLVALVFAVRHLENQEAFPNYQTVLMAATSFIRPLGLIFSAILLSRLVIDEFRHKTISLMFTYPISRQSIMLRKSLMIIVFTFFTLLFSMVFLLVSIVGLNPIVHFVSTPFDFSVILQAFGMILIDALLLSLVSLIPMYFGMRQYSTAATFVTSAAIVLSLSTPLGTSMISLSVLALIGLACLYLTLKKVKTADI